MVFNSFLDPVLGPVMSIPSPWNLLLISFILTTIITLIYKFVTDQKMMKELKDEMKAFQKEMKELKDNPSKMMEVQKKAMEKNMKYMMHSLKPTLITFIPIIFIFGWLRSYYIGLGNPDILFGLGWIWIYIIFSIVLSLALRKILKIY
ncbi:MAG: EMC3/TMCO1 family protein [archaeon]